MVASQAYQVALANFDLLRLQPVGHLSATDRDIDLKLETNTQR